MRRDVFMDLVLAFMGPQAVACLVCPVDSPLGSNKILGYIYKAYHFSERWICLGLKYQ